MITKEILLTGMENNLVHIGAYTENGVMPPQEGDDFGELACAIGEYSFYFPSGKEYASIQEYLDASSPEEVAQDVAEAIQTIRNEANPEEASYYESFLTEHLPEKEQTEDTTMQRISCQVATNTRFEDSDGGVLTCIITKDDDVYLVPNKYYDNKGTFEGPEDSVIPVGKDDTHMLMDYLCREELTETSYDEIFDNVPDTGGRNTLLWYLDTKEEIECEGYHEAFDPLTIDGEEVTRESVAEAYANRFGWEEEEFLERLDDVIGTHSPRARKMILASSLHEVVADLPKEERKEFYFRASQFLAHFDDKRGVRGGDAHAFIVAVADRMGMKLRNVYSPREEERITLGKSIQAELSRPLTLHGDEKKLASTICKALESPEKGRGTAEEMIIDLAMQGDDREKRLKQMDKPMAR